MTRRQIARRALSPAHKRAMLNVRHAPRGQVGRYRRELRDVVTKLLQDAWQKEARGA